MGWFGQDGERIHFDDEGTGVPVVVIPGWGGGNEDMAFLRSVLVSKFRAIWVEPPGCGLSEPQPRDYTPSYYVDDARSILALIDHLGAAPVHAIGYSDGGEYALLMAAIRPDAFRSVLAWGAAGHFPPDSPVPEWFMDMVDSPLEPFKGFSEYLKKRYGEDGARLMTRSVAEAWSAILASGGDISRSRAGDITCPVRLIVGETDAFAPPGLVADMAGAISQGEVVTVPGAGHGVHHSHQEWLTNAISNWLGQ